MGLYINAKTATKTELQLKVMFWINSPVEDRGSKAALERPLSRIVAFDASDAASEAHLE